MVAKPVAHLAVITQVMALRPGSYARYSAALLLTWAVVLLLVWEIRGAAEFHIFLTVGAGYFLGWFSATIARSIYRS